MRTLSCFLLASTFLFPLLASEDPTTSRLQPRSTIQSASERVDELEKLSAKKDLGMSDSDLERLAQDARDFAEDAQDHALGAKAKKIEALTILRLRSRGHTAKSDKRADDYINDSSLPVADRFDVAAYSKNIELSPKTLKTKEDVRSARIRNARFLVEKFPSEERGYGYLIALSALPSGARDVSMLEEVARSSQAPARVRTLAKRIISQQGFMASSINGLDLTAYSGRQLVIYLWSSRNPKILEEIVRLKSDDKLIFVGINVDKDSSAGRNLIEILKVPGLHFFDGARGETVKQLGEIDESGVYFFEKDGALGALPQPLGKLLRLSAKIGKGDAQ